jgi:hypothetical protein
MATVTPKEPKPQITLLEAITTLTEKHGSQAEASRQTGINKTYWSRLSAGIKDWPSDDTLAKLGLRRNVSYEWVRQPRGKKASAQG